jgi:hypothetical protein
MGFQHRFGSLVVLFAVSLVALPVAGEEEIVPPQDAADTADAETMARLMELGKPGPEHDRLASLVGTWQENVMMRAAPGTEPMTAVGRCTNRMILGGRFLRSECESEDGPRKVEGLIIFGFDRRGGAYTMVGFDTMGTYYITAAGPWDEDREAIVMSGEDEDPVNGFVRRYDLVLRPEGDDRYVTEVYFKNPEPTGDVDAVKMVEIELTRVE